MGLFNKKTSSSAKATDDKKNDNKKVITKPVIKDSTKKSAEKSERKSVTSKNATAYRFLLRPIISEKATVGAADGKYTFEVAIKANKVAIKKAIQEVYGVLPTAVNIINKRGKSVSFGRRHGSTSNIKKAIVTLKKGDSIKLYEGI
ncbi:MAG: 50S ribosomal protein L23 [Patescibacteria group bacterium]|jgi:large subunit ribosomal protein L23